MSASSVTLPGAPDAVPQARELLEAACRDLGLVGQPADDVLLAGTEAVTNAVRHGYPGEEEGTVEVGVGHEDATLVVTVVDHGVGLDHGPETDPGMGAGLGIMRRLAEVEQRATPGGGTTVVLRFALGAPAPSA